MLQSTAPNKNDTVVKNTKPVLVNSSTNSSNQIESMPETHNQIPSSSKSSETSNQSSSLPNLPVSDKVSTASQPEVQNNSTFANSKTIQSSPQFQNAGAKVFNSKLTTENKTKSDNGVQTVSKYQPPLQKTYSPPMNSQQTHGTTDSKPQITAFKGSPRNDSTKSIDLSSISNVLEDVKNKDEKSAAMSNDTTDEKSKSNSDHKQQTTSNLFISIYSFKL